MWKHGASRLLALALVWFSSALYAQDIDRKWLALLHFQHGQAQSDIDDATFFISDRGHRDPAAELQATIAAMQSDSLLRCRYPARYAYLRERGLVDEAEAATCGEYAAWRAKLNVDEVVLVMAASYLNSPSSMYGHTFLRLDPAGERSASAFLSHALNFAANIPPGENGMLYAYKGIFGGYPGHFSLQPYYEKIQEYNRLENRDMWEYGLNLTSEEIDRLLGHVWELRGVNFGYYFFDENCAYRLLEVLDVARPGVDLSDRFRYTAIPVDTVRAVAAAGLLAEVEYRPSKRVELDAVLQSLNDEQKQLVEALQDDVAVLGSAAYTRQSEADRAAVALASYRLLRYRRNRDARDSAAAQRSHALLREVGQYRAKLPAFAVPTPPRPDLAHGSGRASVSLGRSDGRDFVQGEWRISYHDALDPLPGYLPGATLAMGQLAFRQYREDGARLQYFDPLYIRSLSVRDRFFSPKSWQVRAGFTRLEGAEGAPMTARVKAGMGGSWSLLGGVSYLLPGVQIEHNSDAQQNWRLAPLVELGQLYQGEQVSVEVTATVSDFGRDGRRETVAASLAWAVGRNQSLRFSAAQRSIAERDSTEVQLSWRSYF